MNNNRIINIFKGLLALSIYFGLSIFNTLPLYILNIDYESMATIFKEIYNLTTEIIIILIICLIFKDYLKKAFNDLKQNHFEYFTGNLKYYIIGVAIMMGANAIINVLGGGMSGNESAVRDEFSIAPIYTYISAVFLAPVVEELVFRLSFRNIFKNNVLFILISGLIFGSLHLLSGCDLLFLPLYLLSYSGIGFMFAYILTKTDNIFVTIGFHMMHNGILMSLQVALLLFG